MFTVRQLALTLAILLTTAACASDETPSLATATLVAPTATGGQIDFGSLEGSDTILWFWAPW